MRFCPSTSQIFICSSYPFLRYVQNQYLFCKMINIRWTSMLNESLSYFNVFTAFHLTCTGMVPYLLVHRNLRFSMRFPEQISSGNHTEAMIQGGQRSTCCPFLRWSKWCNVSLSRCIIKSKVTLCIWFTTCHQ